MPKAARKTILVLEDEPLVMAIFQQVLRIGGYEVHAAVSAKEALDKFTLHRQDIDLLITDLAVPDSNGLHVALVCCLASPKVGVILTSGAPFPYWTEKQQREFDALPQDRVGLLPKPFSVGQLRETVSRMLEAARGA